MAIQPCHYCSRPVQSGEQYMHNVACQDESCQEQKQAAHERMLESLDRADREWKARRAARIAARK